MLQNTVMFNKDGDNPAIANPVLDGLENNFIYTEQGLRDYLASQGIQMVANPNPSLKGASITGIDPDFKLPQVAKFSLAADMDLGLSFPASLTVEGIFNKDINAVYVENYNQMNIAGFSTFKGADNRVDFSDQSVVSPVVSKSGGAMVIRNTDKGYSWSASATIKAEPLQNLKTELSYIHIASMAVSDMTGSDLKSTWANTPNVNSPNEVVLRPSAYVIPDKVTASVTYLIEYARNKHLSTEVGLFYTGQNAGTFSYTYSNDMNGDGVTNDLIYIPANVWDVRFVDINNADGTVRYTAEEQKDAFVEYVNSDHYLNSNLGKYAKANAARMPWVNRFDLHVAQNLNLARLL